MKQLALLKFFFAIVTLFFLGRGLLTLVRDTQPDGSPAEPVAFGVVSTIVGALALLGYAWADYKTRTANGESPKSARIALCACAASCASQPGSGGDASGIDQGPNEILMAASQTLTGAARFSYAIRAASDELLEDAQIRQKVSFPYLYLVAVFLELPYLVNSDSLRGLQISKRHGYDFR